MKNKNENGTILVLVIGILAILSLMAATLVTVMRLQGEMARNYTDDAQLELLADAALEYGIGVLISDRNITGAKDYDSTSEKWTSMFTGTDVQVWPLSGTNDAKWVEIYDRDISDADKKQIGKFALKIIDQSALIYANETTASSATAMDALYESITDTGSGGVTPGAIHLTETSGVEYIIPEMIQGVDSNIIPYFYATKAYLSDTSIGWTPAANAPLNINTHLEMFVPFTTVSTMMEGLLAGSPNITRDIAIEIETALYDRIDPTGTPNPFTESTGLADIETAIAGAAVTGAGTDQESLIKNDAMNILVNFTGGTDTASPASLAEGSTYRAATESYSNYNFVTAAIQGIDPTSDATTTATSLTAFVQTMADAGASNQAKDLGANGTQYVRREICFKSSVFEIWGQAVLYDHINDQELPGIRAFVAIVDRGIRTGEGAKVVSFRWLPQNYMDKYEMYY